MLQASAVSIGNGAFAIVYSLLGHQNMQELANQKPRDCKCQHVSTVPGNSSYNISISNKYKGNDVLYHFKRKLIDEAVELTCLFSDRYNVVIKSVKFTQINSLKIDVIYKLSFLKLPNT